jgi:hypothetical protein
MSSCRVERPKAKALGYLDARTAFGGGAANHYNDKCRDKSNGNCNGSGRDKSDGNDNGSGNGKSKAKAKGKGKGKNNCNDKDKSKMRGFFAVLRMTIRTFASPNFCVAIF